MIVIQPLEEGQILAAKRVILSVARGIYGWEEPLAKILEQFDNTGEFADMDDFQNHYQAPDGEFLVVLDGQELVGTAAIHRWGEGIAELKRFWLQEAYQAQGIGYRLLQMLIQFAREQGCQRIRLETDEEQVRARHFYRRAGFQPIEKYNERDSDYYLELII